MNADTHDTVQLLNTLGSLFNGAHFDEAKTTGAVRLENVLTATLCFHKNPATHSLIIHNGNLFNATKAAELVF